MLCHRQHWECLWMFPQANYDLHAMAPTKCLAQCPDHENTKGKLGSRSWGTTPALGRPTVMVVNYVAIFFLCMAIISFSKVTPTKCSMLEHSFGDDEYHANEVSLRELDSFYIVSTPVTSSTCLFVDAKADIIYITHQVLDGLSQSNIITKSQLMVISGLVNHGTKASLMASSLNYLWSTGTTFTPSPQLATPPLPPNSS